MKDEEPVHQFADGQLRSIGITTANHRLYLCAVKNVDAMCGIKQTESRTI